MTGRRAIAVMLGAAFVATLCTAVVGAGWWASWPPWLVSSVAASAMAICTCITGAMFTIAVTERPAAPPLPPVVPLGAEPLGFELSPPSPIARSSTPAPPAPPDAVPFADVRAILEALGTWRFGEVERIVETLPEPLRPLVRQTATRWSHDRQMAHEYVERQLASHEATLLELQDTIGRLTTEIAASNQARDAFLSRMSHELRTPLNAILGYAEMLDEDLTDDDLREDARRIRTSAANLLGTVTAVLDLTQLQSGQYDVTPQLIDIEELVREVGAAIADEARTNRDVVELAVPPGTTATLDRRMLRAILFNLSSNACKYTKKGTVRVQAQLTGDRLVLVVADTGIGMTQRQIEAAFTPFAQGDESTTRRYDGTGLGLSVVHGFVEAMGGTLRITSEPGQGAVVEVDLPRDCRPRDSILPSTSLLDEQPTMLAR